MIYFRVAETKESNGAYYLRQDWRPKSNTFDLTLYKKMSVYEIRKNS